MQLQFIRVTTGIPAEGRHRRGWTSGQGNSVSLAASAGARSRLLRRNQVDNSENRNVPISDFVDNAHLASAASRGAATAAGKSHGMPDWSLARNFC